MNVVANGKVLHSSLTPITISSFPIQYSIEINEREVALKHVQSLQIVAAIWQATYIHESTVKVPTTNEQSLDFTVQEISKPKKNPNVDNRRICS